MRLDDRTDRAGSPFESSGDPLGGDAGRMGHAGAAMYLPLDTLKPLADDIWIVDSGPLLGSLPVRMTVIRLPGGDVLLHSPTRIGAGLRDEIDGLGPVRFLVAPNVAHWMFLPEWQRAYPRAEIWAAPGLRRRRQVRRAGVRVDHDLSETLPAAWAGALDAVIVPGGLGFSEVAFFHRPSRTLVLTDLVLNLEAARLPALLRPLARLAGMTAPHGRAPVYLRAVVKLAGSRAAEAAARVVAFRPERVIFAHGRILDQDATEALRRSLAWLLPQG
jgi:hypothetical protein